MSVQTAPCDWPCVGDCSAFAGLGEPLTSAAKAAAVAFLWEWTGRRFGACETTVRPSRRPHTPGTWSGPSPWRSAFVLGRWSPVFCGGCGMVCGCGSPTRLRLPGPIVEVSTVTVGGDVLDPEAWRVDGRSTLVRQDGEGWPATQDLTLPDGEPGTWSVTYQAGEPVPEGGQIAAGVLACEMAKALTADRTCQLPERISNQVTREGVTVTILDQFEGLEAGRTGLWLVDSWVTSIRQPSRPAKVVAPQRRRPGPSMVRSR